MSLDTKGKRTRKTKKIPTDLRMCKQCSSKPAAKSYEICWCCKSKNFREKNRICCVYHWIKKSAKKRNIEFTITQAWFREFIKDTGYIEGSGRLRDHLTLDRIDGMKGYIPGNLRVIKRHENSEKFHNKEAEYPNNTIQTHENPLTEDLESIIVNDTYYDIPF